VNGWRGTGINSVDPFKRRNDDRSIPVQTVFSLKAEVMTKAWSWFLALTSDLFLPMKTPQCGGKWGE